MAVTKDLELRVSELATRAGQEIKKLRGELTAGGQSTSADKVSYNGTTVAATLDKHNTELAKKVEIDDAQASGTKTYSSQKVEAQITAAKKAVKDELLNGAGEAFDTLKELGDAITVNGEAIKALQEIAKGHVKYDGVQSLDDGQKAQARANIAAAPLPVEKATTDLNTLKEVGDFVVTGATNLPAGFTADPVFVTVKKAGNNVVQMVGGVQGAEYKLFARTATADQYGEFAQIGAKQDLSNLATKQEVTEAVKPAKDAADAAQAKANENAGKIATLEGTVGGHTTSIADLSGKMTAAEASIKKNSDDIAQIRTDIGTKTDYVAAFEAALA